MDDTELKDVVERLGRTEIFRFLRVPKDDNGSLNYSSIGALSKYDTPKPSDVFVSDHLSGGDYSGGGLVNRSNYEVFIAEYGEEPGVYELHGGHGSYGVAVRLDSITDAMMETFDALESYPVLDENKLSEMEIEAEDEAWKDFYAKEFAEAIRKDVTAEVGEELEDIVDEVVDEITEGDLYELFREGMNESNTYWEHDSEGTKVDIKRIMKEVDLEPIIEAVYKEAKRQDRIEEDPDALPPIDPRQMALPGVSERRRRARR